MWSSFNEKVMTYTVIKSNIKCANNHIILYGYAIIINIHFRYKMIWTIMIANILLLILMWIGKEMASKLIKEMANLVSVKFVIKKQDANRRHNSIRQVGRIQLRRPSNRPLSRRRTRVNLERRRQPPNYTPPNYNDLETEISEACRLINRDLTKQEKE